MEFVLSDLWFVVPALLMVALAAVVLWIDSASRLSRAFALFLVLRGGVNIVGLYTTTDDHPQSAETVLMSAVFPYFEIALVFAALYFALCFHERYTGGARVRALPWALLGAALVFEVVYALDHDLYGTFPSGAFYGPDALYGPLYLLSSIRNASYAVIGCMFLAGAARATERPTARAFLLVGLGLLYEPLYYGAATITDVGMSGVTGRFAETHLSIPLSLVLMEYVPYALATLAAPIAWRVAPAAAGRAAGALTGRRARVALALPLGAGILISVLFFTGSPAWDVLVDPLGSAFLLAMPLLAGYALLRHRLFDLDLKLKWTIRRGTLAAVFVAVFLAATQVAQLYLEQEGGLLVGGVATGLMLFAIAPLQRFAERVADTTLPGVKSAPEMDASERLAVYADQVRFAWADGTLDASERALLSQLRERLGLSAEAAARCEDDIVASMRHGGPNANV